MFTLARVHNMHQERCWYFCADVMCWANSSTTARETPVQRPFQRFLDEMSVVSGIFTIFIVICSKNIVWYQTYCHTYLSLFVHSAHRHTVICNYCGINIRRFFVCFLLRQYLYITSMCAFACFSLVLYGRESPFGYSFFFSFICFVFVRWTNFFLSTLSFLTKMVKRKVPKRNSTIAVQCENWWLCDCCVCNFYHVYAIEPNTFRVLCSMGKRSVHTKIIRFVSIYGNATIHIFHRVKRFLK